MKNQLFYLFLLSLLLLTSSLRHQQNDNNSSKPTVEKQSSQNQPATQQKTQQDAKTEDKLTEQPKTEDTKTEVKSTQELKPDEAVTGNNSTAEEKNSNESTEKNSTQETKPDEKNSTQETKPDEKNSTQETKPDQKNSTDEQKPDQKNSTDEKTPDEKNSTQETKPDQKNSTDEKKPDQKNSTQETKPDEKNSTQETKPDQNNSTDEKKPDQKNSTDEKKPDQKNSTDEKKPDQNNSTGEPKDEVVQQQNKIDAQSKQQAERLANQDKINQQNKLNQEKQLQNLKAESEAKMKQLYDQLIKTYQPKPEDKQAFNKQVDNLFSEIDDLQKTIQSRQLSISDQVSQTPKTDQPKTPAQNKEQSKTPAQNTDQSKTPSAQAPAAQKSQNAAHYHSHKLQLSFAHDQEDLFHLLSVQNKKCYNLTDSDQKLIDDTKVKLQNNLTKLKIFLDKSKQNTSLATEQQRTNLQNKYNDIEAKLNKLRSVKKCTPQQVKKVEPSPTPVKLPTGMGISQAQSYFKNITNMNAPNWILGNQTLDEFKSKLFNYLTHNNITKCPLQTPFARKSDNQCIKCEQPKPIFDLNLGDCVACPAGTKFDQQTHKCIPQKAAPKCKANYIWNQQQKKCVCPSAFPIDLGCECVTCLEPFAWDINERVCKLRCPEQSHVWNKQKQACECPQSTPYEYNGQCISCNLPFQWQTSTNTCILKVNQCAAAPTPTQCSSNYVYDNAASKCICPSNLPFNDGTKCVSCDLPQYWDHDLKSCLSCPQLKYFSTITRNCQSCPSDKPLFRNNACQACSAGTNYDRNSNTCVPNQPQFIDPTATNKIPVYNTVPTTPQQNFIDPSTTNKIPVYNTSQ